MTKFTERFLEYSEKYHAKYPSTKIEVDWNVYTKNPSNPDETARAVHIYTENLELSSIHVNDTDNSYKFLYSDEEVMKFYGPGKPWPTEFVTAWMETMQARWESKNPISGFVIQVEDKDEFVGNVSLAEGSRQQHQDDSVVLVYSIAKSFHGKGYGKESIGAVTFDWMKYAIENDLHMSNGSAIKNVVATVDPQNIPSIRILQGLGLEYEKTEFKKEWNTDRAHYKMDIVEEMGGVAASVVDTI